MAISTVCFGQSAEKIKPMHATNNGPSLNLEKYNGGNVSITNCNLDLFKDAGIPFARTHDASFHPAYGLEHTVDVHMIFRDFEKDETDPDAYDFTLTDHYVKCCELSGTKVFYRLGSRIEHEPKKYGTLPPPDFHKWARICEHIIRHFNEGWADGFHMGIEYWEIWNEPDLDPDDSTDKRTWGGSQAQFFDLYEIAAKHLKTCFPRLKIGGPAVAGNMEWAAQFLAEMQKRNVPMDFFSWHRYACEIEKMATRAKDVRELMDQHGYKDAESILNEWNYVQGWHGEELVYSQKHHWTMKGAAFTLSAMCACQQAPVDMLMYYDARPTPTWNGMFDPVAVGIPLKGYYPFPMFNELYKLQNAVACEGERNLYLAAAEKDDSAAVVLCHYNNDDSTGEKPMTLDLQGFSSPNGVQLECYLLDENHSMEKVQTFTYYGDRFVWETELPNFTCYLLKLKKL